MPALPDDAAPGASEGAGRVGVFVAALSGLGVEVVGPGCQWRVLSASRQNATRRRLLHPQRKLAVLRLPDSLATAAWPASAASASRAA